MVAGLRLSVFFFFTTFACQHANQDNVTHPASPSLVESKVKLVDHMAAPKCDKLPFDICGILVRSRFVGEKKCKGLSKTQIRHILVTNAVRWSFQGRARHKSVVQHYQAMSTNDLISAVAQGLTMLQKKMISRAELRTLTDIEQREYLAKQVFHCTGEKKTLDEYKQMDTWRLVTIARCCRHPTQIKSMFAEDCLEYDGIRDVQMKKCDAGTTQKWFLAGEYIKERSHFKCLEIGKGGHIVAVPCSGKKTQKWTWKGPQIKSIGKGLCLSFDKEGLSAEDCIKGRTKSQHWYTVEGKFIRSFVKRGERLLSCNEDGSKLFLVKADSGSGRELWTITKGKGYWYHIQVAGGTLDGKKYLSADKTGKKLVLAARDDMSGRQRWKITQSKKADFYNIQVKGGVPGGTFLSMLPDGSKMRLRMEPNTDEEKWMLPLSFKMVEAPSFDEEIAERMDKSFAKKSKKEKALEAKARPLVYYTKRDRKSGWEVQLGKCKVVVGEKRPCIISPFYPSAYRGEEVCIIKAPGTTQLHVDTFKTEKFFDFLQIDKERYWGDLSKKKIPMQGDVIVWSSDFFDESKGWKICQHKEGLKVPV